MPIYGIPGLSEPETPLYHYYEFQHSMVNFHSHQHQLHTIKQTKKSLSPFDDKRYILEDGFTTRAHGHYQNGITRLIGLVNCLLRRLATCVVRGIASANC